MVDESKRNFLKGASAAFAAPSLVSAKALGGTASTGANERIGIGIIGLGGRGMSHLSALLRRPEVQVVALCDPYREKREAAEAKVSAAYQGDASSKVFSAADFRELLSLPEVDAVVIASPEHWHGLQSAAAARRGKDVYCEKALTLTVPEGRDLIGIVRRHQCVFQLGTQQRSDGSFRRACELARSGYLGDLQEAYVSVPGGRPLPAADPKEPPEGLDYDLWLGPAPYTPYNDLKCTFNWYFIYDYCVGWIQSWGVHHLDVAAWGMPDVGKGRIQVEGEATFPTEGIANTSVTWKVRFETENGVRVHFADNAGARYEQGCRFVGKEGWVHVKRGKIYAEPDSLLRVRLRPEEEHLYASKDHHGNWLDCIRSRKDPVAPVEAGHLATTLSLIGDIATRVGAPLVWDWSQEKFVQNDGANRRRIRAMRSPWSIHTV